MLGKLNHFICGMSVKSFFDNTFNVWNSDFTGAISYIELASVCPKNGGEYTYLMAAFGPGTAFLFMWTSTLVLKPASVAIITLAFAEYTIDPFVNDISQYKWLVELIAAIAIGRYAHFLTMRTIFYTDGRNESVEKI